MSKQTLWKWEKGLVKLEADQIQALCDAFGCAHYELACTEPVKLMRNAASPLI